MDSYFLWAASFIALLFLSGIIWIIARKIHLPYTIALVWMGILLALITHTFPTLQFLTTFELSQETLLYVFLPVLLFESAYNIKFRELIQHTRAITLLAVVALILSAMITAGILFYTLGSIGIAVPFLVLFLFGTLISATDPVSVLALFKEMGAPKRLTLIFEGESLFNDGTALALFFVILSLLLPHGHTHESFFVQLVSHLAPFLGSTFPVFSGIVSFLCMIGMGFLLGGLIGYTAAKSVPYIRKSKLLEVMLTVILAHATFLFAEWMHHTFFPVSAVIATTIAALVMGNYGHYKLSYQTRHMMHEYWEFFAFIVNSLVFLLVGVMMMRLNIHVSELILPMAIAIIAVAVGRAISVYSVLIPLNQTKKEYPIPTTWMHLLSWGSLRGGLAIIIALFIPEDFTLPWWTLDTSIRDFVLALTVGCIVFTTFIKATSMPWLLKKLQITTPSPLEHLDTAQGRILFLLKFLARIDSTATRGFLSDDQKRKLTTHYQAALREAHAEFFSHISDQWELEILLERTLALHALEIEKSLLMHLYNHHELPEWILRRMMNKMDSQIERIEEGKTQIKEAYEHKIPRDPLIVWIEYILQKFWKKRDIDTEKYYKARTRMIILEKVLHRFEIFDAVEEIAHSKALQAIRERYTRMLEAAKHTRTELYKKPSIQVLENTIINDMLHARKYDIIHELQQGGFITIKTAQALDEAYIEHESFRA